MEKYNLKVIGNSIEFGDIDFLDNYKFYNNTFFPDSYKDFVKKYGYGITLGEFFIYIPMDNYGDSWNIRTEAIKNTYYNDIIRNNIWFELEPDGNIELLKRLVPFSSSENGEYLFWDPETKNGNEFNIYITDFRGMGFRKAGNTLYEVIGKNGK
ncbi:SMI1/KNR4 family protein [Breznakiellaceae bacterium SP9]